MVIFLLIMVFVLGTIVGSLLNVCIYRIPLEKSILWPGSRCSSCLQPVRWYDNLPLVTYLALGGRCRTCGATFSPRYFLVELLTGLVFAGLFYAEIVANIHNIPVVWSVQGRLDRHLMPGAQAWVIFGYHALLASFLLVATFCDLDHREIPLGLTLTGTAVGLTGSILFPWPWPAQTPVPAMPENRPWWMTSPNLGPGAGLYLWPVWGPLPDWLPPGSWQLGLATGLVGMLVGTLMLRLVRFLFSTGLGVEALGLGDADLMMMAGSFLGWQPIVVGFFLSVIPGLLFAGCHIVGRRLLAIRPTTSRAAVRIHDGKPLVMIDDEAVALERLPDRLTELAGASGKRDLVLDGKDLQNYFDDVLESVQSLAVRSGFRRIALKSDIGNVGFLKSFWPKGASSLEKPPHLRLELSPGANGVLVKGLDLESSLEGLQAQLGSHARSSGITELIIDTKPLEKWLQRIQRGIRMQALTAGFRKVHERDNAIPYGPALAVGVFISLLGWRSIGPRVHIIFWNGPWLFGLAAVCAVLMLVSSYGIRVGRLVRHGSPGGSIPGPK